MRPEAAAARTGAAPRRRGGWGLDGTATITGTRNVYAVASADNYYPYDYYYGYNDGGTAGGSANGGAGGAATATATATSTAAGTGDTVEAEAIAYGGAGGVARAVGTPAAMAARRRPPLRSPAPALAMPKQSCRRSEAMVAPAVRVRMAVPVRQAL